MAYTLRGEELAVTCQYVDYVIRNVVCGDYTDMQTIDYASMGNMPMLQWALKNGAEWSRHSTNEAARRGHLNVVKFMISLDPINHSACQYTARGGQLHVLQWLMSLGVTENTIMWTCRLSLEQLEILKWLETNHWLVGVDECIWVSSGETLTWLLRRKPQSSILDTRILTSEV